MFSNYVEGQRGTKLENVVLGLLQSSQSIWRAFETFTFMNFKVVQCCGTVFYGGDLMEKT